ncbi:hypothetical protein OH76DRAFT_1423196, partial [Lentinus brumalis]
FLRPNVNVIRAAVTSVLEKDEMIAMLTELTKNNRRMRHIPPKDRAAFVIDSLEIKMTEAEDGEPVANVYLFPPTEDMKLWRAWAARMRSEKFNIFMNGTGRARRIYWCSGCRGVDHETDECRLPEMDGWKGPNPGAGDKLHTTLPILELARKKKTGRGNPHDSQTYGQRKQPMRGGGGWQGALWETRGGLGRGAKGRDNGQAGGPRGGGRRGTWNPRTPANWTPGHGRGGNYGWAGGQSQPPRW